MLTDRLIRLLLGSIAMLLLALLIQTAMRSPEQASASITYPNSGKTYAMKIVGQANIDDIKEVVPMAPDENGVNFVVQTKTGVVVYRCGYYVAE
jgi:hypothetical protein